MAIVAAAIAVVNGAMVCIRREPQPSVASGTTIVSNHGNTTAAAITVDCAVASKLSNDTLGVQQYNSSQFRSFWGEFVDRRGQVCLFDRRRRMDSVERRSSRQRRAPSSTSIPAAFQVFDYTTTEYLAVEQYNGSSWSEEQLA